MTAVILAFLHSRHRCRRRNGSVDAEPEVAPTCNELVKLASPPSPPVVHRVSTDDVDVHASVLLSPEEAKLWSEKSQAAGHAGRFVVSKQHVFKVYNEKEHGFYNKMEDAPPGEAMKGFVPRSFGRVEVDGVQYLKLENVLQGFTEPRIIDMKLGVRTFQVSEVQKTAVRADLLGKMQAIDPAEPTPQELQQGGITKLRYMTYREQQSSSATMGFRVDGISQGFQGAPTPGQLKKLKERADVMHVFTRVSAFEGKEGHFMRRLRGEVIKRLEALRGAIAVSPVFMTHEFVGSSLLVILDATGKVGVWLIDFDKALALEGGKRLKHTVPWQNVPGNREDGYIMGIDTMLELWKLSASEELPELSSRKVTKDRQVSPLGATSRTLGASSSRLAPGGGGEVAPSLDGGGREDDVAPF